MARAPLLTAAILLLINACSGCSTARPWSFTVIDAAAGRESLFSSADNDYTLGGGASLFYSTDGSVVLVDEPENVEIKNSGASVRGLPLYGVISGAGEIPLITEVYDMSASALERGENVMIVYLDGFGWDSWQKAKNASLMPELEQLSCTRAASVFPTITPVNYAAMVTGKTPDENGVTARGIHKLNCDSIFDLCTSLGGTALVIESSTQIIEFSCPQELCPDMDGDGDTDTEVVDAALSAIESQSPELILVHLHGIDDTSHEFSPDSDELLNKLRETDGYLHQFFAAWDGKIIVCADHGQHTNDGNGDPSYADREGIHGAFTASDIFTPIFTN